MQIFNIGLTPIICIKVSKALQRKIIKSKTKLFASVCQMVIFSSHTHFSMPDVTLEKVL